MQWDDSRWYLVTFACIRTAYSRKPKYKNKAHRTSKLPDYFLLLRTNRYREILSQNSSIIFFKHLSVFVFENCSLFVHLLNIKHKKFRFSTTTRHTVRKNKQLRVANQPSYIHHIYIITSRCYDLLCLPVATHRAHLYVKRYCKRRR